MVSSQRHRREQLEQQLRAKLLRAEAQLKQAIPEVRGDALLLYEEALHRFSRLVVTGELPGEGLL
jgi:hypothetical protein